MQAEQRHHRRGDGGQPVIDLHVGVGDGDREKLDGQQQGRRAEPKQRAGQAAAEDRAEQPLVAPLPRRAVARPHDHRDGEEDPVAVPEAGDQFDQRVAEAQRQREPQRVAEDRRRPAQLLDDRVQRDAQRRREGADVDAGQRLFRKVLPIQQSRQAGEVRQRERDARAGEPRRAQKLGIGGVIGLQLGDPARKTVQRRIAVGQAQVVAADDEIERKRVEIVGDLPQQSFHLRGQTVWRIGETQRRMIGQGRDDPVEGLQHGGERGDQPGRFGTVGGRDDEAARGLQMVRERGLMLDDLEADLALVGVLAIEGGDAAQIGGEFAQHSASVRRRPETSDARVSASAMGT